MLHSFHRHCKIYSSTMLIPCIIELICFISNWYRYIRWNVNSVYVRDIWQLLICNFSIFVVNVTTGVVHLSLFMLWRKCIDGCLINYVISAYAIALCFLVMIFRLMHINRICFLYRLLAVCGCILNWCCCFFICLLLVDDYVHAYGKLTFLPTWVLHCYYWGSGCHIM